MAQSQSGMLRPVGEEEGLFEERPGNHDQGCSLLRPWWCSLPRLKIETPFPPVFGLSFQVKEKYLWAKIRMFKMSAPYKTCMIQIESKGTPWRHTLQSATSLRHLLAEVCVGKKVMNHNHFTTHYHQVTTIQVCGSTWLQHRHVF